MMISIRPLAALCLLLLACGPKISGESAEEGEASSTTEAPGTESGPPGSSGGPTTTPLDTGEGTADSGVVDTGEVWLDLPTSCSTFDPAKCVSASRSTIAPGAMPSILALQWSILSFSARASGIFRTIDKSLVM